MGEAVKRAKAQDRKPEAVEVENPTTKEGRAEVIARMTDEIYNKFFGPDTPVNDAEQNAAMEISVLDPKSSDALEKLRLHVVLTPVMWDLEQIDVHRAFIFRSEQPDELQTLDNLVPAGVAR